MPSAIDISGKRFGRLIAIACVGRSRRGELVWSVACDCGNKREVDAYQINSGRMVSCGCYRREQIENGSVRMRAGKRSWPGSY